MALSPVPPKGLYVGEAGCNKIGVAPVTCEAGAVQYGACSADRRRRHRRGRRRGNTGAQSDGLVLAEREASAKTAIDDGLNLKEAVSRHLHSVDKAARRDIRVAAAAHYITADACEGRQSQLAAFRALIAETCATLQLNNTDTGRVKSAFIKAAWHRVTPILHECKEVQLGAVFQWSTTPAPTAGDGFTPVD